MKYCIRLLSAIFTFFLIQNRSLGQEKVDITTCDASNSGVICVSATDSLYEVCVKLKPGPSPTKIYKINWGDGHSNEMTINAETTTKHSYDLRSFIKNCGDNELEQNISIKNVNPDFANDNKGFILTFNKKPDANPIVNAACEGKAISFNNASCPRMGITYLWEFSDGRKSTEYIPNISFTDPDQTYLVKLTATSRNCGVSSKQIPFRLEKLPTADFTKSGYTVSNTDTVVCLANGGLLTLDGSISLEETGYSWTISGGSYKYASGDPNSNKIQIQLQDSKEYTITLVAKNSCGNSKPLVCKHRAVTEPSLTIKPQADDCNPIKYKLVSPNPEATYTFNGSPLGLNEEKEAGYSTTPYIIRASLKHACGVKEAKPDTFFITPKQAVKITSFRDTTICVGTSAVNLQATPAGGTWFGSYIEKQKVFNPSTVGSYEIKYVLGTGGCATHDSIKVRVEGVNITASDASICQGQTKVPLKATPAGGIWTTSVCTGCIANDTLNVNGLTATDIKLTYAVTAAVGGGKSCSAQKEISVKVGRPNADFDISGGCSGTIAKISNKSTGASSYQWFLNGSNTPASTSFLPSLTLPSGNVSVKLVALAGGCNHDITKQIVVSTPPEPLSFNPDQNSGCSPLPVKFSINTPERSDVSYEWDFGDGNNSNIYQPNGHTFNNQTPKDVEFTIKLVAKNTCGQQTQTQKINVKPLAKAEIGVDSTIFRCSPASVKFSNRSAGNQGGSTWLFGDGSTLSSAADTLSHIFSAKDSARIYQVRLVVSNSCGNDTNQVAITVFPEHIKPLFTMSHEKACAGEPVSFKDATVPKPNRWAWKFGNEGKAIGANPVYSFKEANKTYTITMVAYTACGYDSLQRNITTTPPPDIRFSVTTKSACEDEKISLVNNSSGTLYSILWDFGDNSLDSLNFSPDHTYKTAGDKIIKLVGYGNEAKTCKNEATEKISVRKKPTADFKAPADGEVLCSNQLIRLENLSKDAVRYKWYIDKADTVSAVEPELSLPAGFHDIGLVAYYNKTCKDSVYRSGFVEIDACQIEIPEIFTPNNDNIGDFFTAFGSKGLKKILLLRIWNRWGEVIYEKRDFDPNILAEGWNGKINDKEAPEGEYVYELEAEFVGKLQKKYKNNFSLVR